MGLDVCSRKAWCDLMPKEWVPHPDQIRVMEANEKTPVPDGHSKMDVLPEVYLWYHPRLWTQIYCPLKSCTEMYLLKWCVYPVEKSL